MPRRKTRKTTKKENVDPNQSIAEGSDELAVKKEGFLRDFDIHVQERIAAMESEFKSINREIESVFRNQKFLIKKDIRSMRVSDFIMKGGDLKTLDFKEISEAVCDNDVSFQEASKDIDATFKAPVSTVKRTTRKRAPVAQSPLVNDAPLTRTGRATRASTRNMKTPMLSGKNNSRPLQTPLITPKFDPRLPLTVAREPKRGETLMSLAGSPVHSISQNNDTIGNDTVLSLCLSKQQTILGGSLFDMNMSPNTLMSNKDRLQEAINAIFAAFYRKKLLSNDVDVQIQGAINTRLNDLDSQLSSSSKLNET